MPPPPLFFWGGGGLRKERGNVAPLCSIAPRFSTYTASLTPFFFQILYPPLYIHIERVKHERGNGDSVGVYRMVSVVGQAMGYLSGRQVIRSRPHTVD